MKFTKYFLYLLVGILVLFTLSCEKAEVEPLPFATLPTKPNFDSLMIGDTITIDTTKLPVIDSVVQPQPLDTLLEADSIICEGENPYPYATFPQDDKSYIRIYYKQILLINLVGCEKNMFTYMPTLGVSHNVDLDKYIVTMTILYDFHDGSVGKLSHDITHKQGAKQTRSQVCVFKGHKYVNEIFKIDVYKNEAGTKGELVKTGQFSWQSIVNDKEVYSEVASVTTKMPCQPQELSFKK